MEQDIHVRIDEPLYLRRDLLRLALFIERGKNKRFEFLEEEKQKAFLEFATSVREIHKQVTHLKRILPTVVKETEVKERGEIKKETLAEEDKLLQDLRDVEEQLKGVRI